MFKSAAKLLLISLTLVSSSCLRDNTKTSNTLGDYATNQAILDNYSGVTVEILPADSGAVQYQAIGKNGDTLRIFSFIADPADMSDVILTDSMADFISKDIAKKTAELLLENGQIPFDSLGPAG